MQEIDTALHYHFQVEYLWLRIPVILIIKQNLLGISRNLSLRMAFQECLACESDTCNSGGF